MKIQLPSCSNTFNTKTNNKTGSEKLTNYCQQGQGEETEVKRTQVPSELKEPMKAKQQEEHES